MPKRSFSLTGDQIEKIYKIKAENRDTTLSEIVGDAIEQYDAELDVPTIKPNIIEVDYLREDTDIPPFKHAHEYDAGYDLYSIEDKWIWPGQTVLIKSNIRLQVPIGYQFKITGRSGMSKDGWHVYTGTVDSDYIGNIGIIIRNNKLWPRKIHKGQRVAQGILSKVTYMNLEEQEVLMETERGEGGFGHTGKF